MKRIFVMMLVTVLWSSHASGMDRYYQTLRQGIVNIGVKIEEVDNIPFIGKLTTVLPFAWLATGLKKYPMQTAAVVTVVACYLIFRNEKVRAKLKLNKITRAFPWLKKSRSIDYVVIDDESLFVFDIEDEYSDEYTDEEVLYIEDELYVDAENELYAENGVYEETGFYIDELYDEYVENGYLSEEEYDYIRGRRVS